MTHSSRVKDGDVVRCVPESSCQTSTCRAQVIRVMSLPRRCRLNVGHDVMLLSSYANDDTVEMTRPRHDSDESC
jgi:hypothetical protein